MEHPPLPLQTTKTKECCDLLNGYVDIAQRSFLSLKHTHTHTHSHTQNAILSLCHTHTLLPSREESFSLRYLLNTDDAKDVYPAGWQHGPCLRGPDLKKNHRLRGDSPANEPSPRFAVSPLWFFNCCVKALLLTPVKKGLFCAAGLVVG